MATAATATTATATAAAAAVNGCRRLASDFLFEAFSLPFPVASRRPVELEQVPSSLLK